MADIDARLGIQRRIHRSHRRQLQSPFAESSQAGRQLQLIGLLRRTDGYHYYHRSCNKWR